MLNYYSVLNLGIAKKRGIITDEMVKKAYLDKRQRYLEWKDKDSMSSVEIYNEQIIAFVEDNFLDLLEDAYYATRTENARKNYDELLEILESHIQNSKIEEKNRLSQNQKPITDLKDVIQSITRKPESTGELIRKIREDAEVKHPFPQYDNAKDNQDNENQI